MLTVSQTIGPPATISIQILSGYLGLDLRLAQGVSFVVRRRDGTSITLSAKIVAQTAGSLIAQYTFSNAGEITTTGMYYVCPLVNVPGGAVPATAVGMLVTSSGYLSPKLEESAWLAADSPVDGNPIRSTWNAVSAANSPLQGDAFAPWYAFDLTSGTVSVALWTAVDGDVAIASVGVTGSGSGSLIPAAGQGAPLAVPGRYKFSSTLNAWIGW